MSRGLAVPVAVLCVAVASAGCGSSSPSVTAPAPPAAAAAAPAGWKTSSSLEAVLAQAAGGVSKTAVIDGFRVHPDPGDDGVLRVFEGQPVIVNAADLASAPPAPETFLIVSWGDGDGNQRVGCGACRVEHLYASGRYTLVATADDLQPEGRAGRVNRSITLTIEVTPAPAGGIEAVSRFADFAFTPSVLAVGDFGEFFIPRAFFTDPPDNVIQQCTTDPGPPPFAFGPPVFIPRGLVIPIFALTPGRCTLTIISHDADGNQFRDVATVRITP
jgi:hypothetical protein